MRPAFFEPAGQQQHLGEVIAGLALDRGTAARVEGGPEVPFALVMPSKLTQHIA